MKFLKKVPLTIWIVLFCATLAFAAAGVGISSWTEVTTIATGDLVPITDVSNTTGSDDGTSSFIEWGNLMAAPGEIGGTTPAAGTFTSITTSSVADPTLTLKDSDDAAGTGKIFANSDGGANDIILSIGVEDTSGGENTPYIEVDGVTETVDILKPTTLQAGDIVVAEMAANSIDSAQYVDGSIDNEHLADSAVDTAEIAADAVESTKIADDAVDSEHIADGAIDFVHLAADAKFQSLAVADLSDSTTPSVLTTAETTNKVISNYKSTGADHVFTMAAPHVAGNVIFPIGDEFQVDIEPSSGQLFYLNGTAMAADEHIQNTADTLGQRIVGYCVNINGTLRWMFYSGDDDFVEETPPS